MREAVIVSAVRTAVGRAVKGSTRGLRPEAMGVAVIQEVLRRAGGSLRPEQVDDVIMGCAMPEGAQGLNMARLLALAAGLPDSVPAVTVNRFCSSGLQSIAQASERIIAGGADVIIAGGVESMSAVPMRGFHIAPDPALMARLPEAYMNMGLTAERVAAQYGVSRSAQDEFALGSQQRAAAAQDAGKFHDEIIAVELEQAGRLEADEHPRRDTTLAGLAALRPAFKQGGTVTAGNSSPLSDGAAAVLVMERSVAEAHGMRPLLRFVTFAVAGVPPELMGIGPVKAVPKALARAGLTLADMDLIELNEAFAAQAIAVTQALRLPADKLNVNGGAIALGHPLGCTGAKLTVQLLHELQRRQARYGLVTMCIGGGQGAAGIFECLN
ncbi:3-ketoacyl-CoA thiolase [Anaerolineaceae bacterium]|nr:3-ketoacyl-CoA thiolase [Anaerolineaceae bacterium]